jgi:lysine-N-methylase
MFTRPRLSSHVLPRLYERDAVRFVVLYDTQQQATLPVSSRAWACVRGMDGTRDAVGLVAWLQSLGGAASLEEVSALIGELEVAGMVEEGVRETAGATSEDEPAAPASRALLVLPDYELTCDGRGSCCRFYPSIAFTPHDVAKARAYCPEVGGAGLDESRLFVPLAGTTSPMRAVCTVDGRCAYLKEDGACGLHARGGPSAKPVGCSLFPARFVDDGESVRVVPHLECACVFRSGRAKGEGGGPLVPASWFTTSDLPTEVVLDRVMDPVLATPSRALSLAEVRDLAREWGEAPSGTDTLEHLLAFAASLGGERRLAPEEVRPLFCAASAALRPRLEAVAAEPWRSARDLAKLTLDALVTALDLLDAMLEADAETLPASAKHWPDEALYLRVQLFGLGFVAKTGTRSCRTLLFDRAFRVLLGRALGVVVELAELTDPAFDAPLSLVEAAMRGYGLSAYAREIEDTVESVFDRRAE